ncbi:MAG: Fic family protein [Candidatus Peregrinibacteria bacterium]
MQKKYKPDLKKSLNEMINLWDLQQNNPQKKEEYSEYVKNMNSPAYLPWETVKYKPPFQNFSPEESFVLLTISRIARGENTPISLPNGSKFEYEKLTRFDEFFYEFAREFAEKPSVTSVSKDSAEAIRKRLLRGIEEESIASSQIEGANTTRKAAQQMIREKRTPKTTGEKMISKNYEAICLIESHLKNRKMSKELLREIQEIITQGTLKDAQDSGRFRRDADAICITNNITGEVIFTPPPEAFLSAELEKLVAFANDEAPYNEFMSPVLKAIFLHFWIAYLHPFCDGNGRTARAIFYWYLLRRNFLNIGFLPISTEIKKTKTQYENAFLYTEHDENNLTYFIDYMVKILKRAVASYHEYIAEQEQKIQEKSALQEEFFEKNLNTRQVELILFFQKHPSEKTDFYRHQKHQNISLITARKDLLDLEEKGFLKSEKRGKKLVFAPLPHKNILSLESQV